jgi:arabinogalactan endo-1,4-beta-galactosidase
MKLSKQTGLLFILMIAAFTACKKSPAQQPVVPVNDSIKFYKWTEFVMGADLSFVNQVQDYGGVYKDSSIARDPYLIFKNHGANVVRVRLWHNPQWLAPLNAGKLYSDIYDVEKTIKRAKAAGMAVNLDFHYSDTWADPANQVTPAAWAGLSLLGLKDSVYNYTLTVLNYLKANNCTPEMIQVGNENNQGMLWPLGKITNNNFTSFGSLLNSGIKAVRNFSAASPIKPQIILHVAQLQNATYWTNGIIAAGVTDFDILGLSHYSQWTTVNTIADIKNTISTLKSTFNKKIMIVETAYPFTADNADNYANINSANAVISGYPITPMGQYQYMVDLTQAVISGGGSGIMYWEPAWISSASHDLWGTGSSWENNAFFDFKGNILSGIDYMNYRYHF